MAKSKHFPKSILTSLFSTSLSPSHSKPMWELGIFFQNYNPIKSDSFCFEIKLKSHFPPASILWRTHTAQFLTSVMLYLTPWPDSKLTSFPRRGIYSYLLHNQNRNGPPNRNLSVFPRSQDPSSGFHLPHASSHVIGGHITLNKDNSYKMIIKIWAW